MVVGISEIIRLYIRTKKIVYQDFSSFKKYYPNCKNAHSSSLTFCLLSLYFYDFSTLSRLFKSVTVLYFHLHKNMEMEMRKIWGKAILQIAPPPPPLPIE